MSEIKPLGSEKLNGDDKLKRILELTYFNENKKSTSNSSKAEMVQECKAGGVYGIVKEKDGYYVKRGLNESSLDYIGGMFMKNKNKFSSYAEASKRLNLLKGQEELNEGTKYVLKQNKPQQDMAPAAPAMEAPAVEPSMDLPPATTPDVSGDAGMTPDAGMSPDAGMTPDETSPEGGEEMGSDDSTGKRSDYMAEVQKYAGKLGQELRDLHDKMESDDIKYVLNMIISAVELDKLDDEDIEEIGKKFDRDEEVGGEEGGEEMGSEEVPAEEPSAETSTDSELGEGMDKLESFVNSPAYQQDEMNLNDYADLGEEDDLQEIDLDEIKKEINNHISGTLSKYFK